MISCDLADGRFPNAYHYITDDDLALGRPLRTQGKLPYRRLTLLHLHGSLAWLRNPGNGRVYSWASMIFA
jgi:hypothetical protein